MVHSGDGVHCAGAAGLLCLMAITGCDENSAVRTAIARRTHFLDTNAWRMLANRVGHTLAKAPMRRVSDARHRYGLPNRVQARPSCRLPSPPPSPPPPPPQHQVGVYASWQAAALPGPPTPRGPASTYPHTLQGLPITDHACLPASVRQPDLRATFAMTLPDRPRSRSRAIILLIFGVPRTSVLGDIIAKEKFERRGYEEYEKYEEYVLE